MRDFIREIARMREKRDRKFDIKTFVFSLMQQ